MRVPSLLLVALLFAACEAPDAPPPADDTLTDDADMTDVNTLTAAEEAEGFELLFDGESFDGWRGFQREDVPGRWVVEDGALHFNPELEGEGGDIVTADTYEDFDLRFQWKISENGNSGVFYHVSEDAAYDRTYHTGPEYQVLDNEGHPDAQNGLDRTSGANYALHPPSEDVTNPVGEWNTGRIVVDDGRVEHYVNGTLVVEYDLGSDEWEELVAASKFNEMPGYGVQGSGHIAFQDHGDPVWYRDVKIRRL